MSSRIGKGPWARALGAALVPDDTTPEAIHGEELWRRGEVRDLRVETGQITARVEDCAVSITAPTIPPRIWDAMTSYARNRGSLEKAARGELQSVQLEHLMAQDWDEPLIPSRGAILGTCTCDADPACAHLAAVAYAVAAKIDEDPSALLRWRVGEIASDAIVRDADAWRGSAIPELRGAVRRQTESVPKRLGPAGIRVADRDLVDVLAAAYAAFAANRTS
jgi:uncharacterized Zn finger protein